MEFKVKSDKQAKDANCTMIKVTIYKDFKLLINSYVPNNLENKQIKENSLGIQGKQ